MGVLVKRFIKVRDPVRPQLDGVGEALKQAYSLPDEGDDRMRELIMMMMKLIGGSENGSTQGEAQG